MRARRIVRLCRHSQIRGSKARLWAFGIRDLAALFHTTEEGMRARLRRGVAQFDPMDLATVVDAYAEEHRARIVAKYAVELAQQRDRRGLLGPAIDTSMLDMDLDRLEELLGR